MMIGLKNYYRKKREAQISSLFRDIHDFVTFPYKESIMFMPEGEIRIIVKRIELLYKKYPKHLFTWSYFKIGNQYFRKLVINIKKEKETT